MSDKKMKTIGIIAGGVVAVAVVAAIGGVIIYLVKRKQTSTTIAWSIGPNNTIIAKSAVLHRPDGSPLVGCYTQDGKNCFKSVTATQVIKTLTDDAQVLWFTTPAKDT
jgi:hypothetical protein